MTQLIKLIFLRPRFRITIKQNKYLLWAPKENGDIIFSFEGLLPYHDQIVFAVKPHIRKLVKKFISFCLLTVFVGILNQEPLFSF